MKKTLLYTGKAKTLYSTDDPDLLICEYRNDTSAFNGVKTAQLTRKGLVNNAISAFVMQYLESNGIPTCFVEKLSSNESLVKHLTMIPVECVVRNKAAGSLVKRLSLTQGQDLNPPVFECFYKSDELGDPLINESHIETLGFATKEQVQAMKDLSFKANQLLIALFDKAGVTLADFKLEFGTFKGQVVLGDEFSPDACRLWDKETQKVFDKDRFRQDLGDVVESYEEVASRLGVEIPKEVA